MKVHFFDKAGNFLHTEKMEEPKIRHRLAVPEPMEPMEPTLGNGPPEILTMKYRVFSAIPIHSGDGRTLFYLYLEVPR